ncbi:hypothetical protein AVEN_32833-1 [Araneus ventricosus]|uniref:Uncharacterized protein n=1 Tax=Araneus ventricosus TaxID=182803 RepID=A0A4Y2E0I6_ARAVE|nr:hypothetical protein AVEN_32833-1 [Araneus ventricosus]
MYGSNLMAPLHIRYQVSNSTLGAHSINKSSERRKIPAAGLLLSSYFTPTDNREGVGETDDSEADISFGVHQQPERPTAWLQIGQVCGYSNQRATKQNSNSKKI